MGEISSGSPLRAGEIMRNGNYLRERELKRRRLRALTAARPGRLPRSSWPPRVAGLELFREDVLEPDSQFSEDRVEFVQSQVLLSPLKPMQRGVGQAGPLRELGIREAAPFFPQELRKLTVQIAPHERRLSKCP